ncbi:MAG TPA: ABC transporter transmembrane domain-containing protein [Burkholderiales bacterium]|jgi:ATP-binding cassette subfamily B protein|nr:ABC transporter transmembrane domain-containing protein [Burkholderiales bacterium]
MPRADPPVESRSSTPPAPLRRLAALSVLWRFARPYRARIAGFAVALIVAAGGFLVIGQGLKIVVDRGFAGGDAQALNHALFLLLAVVAVMATATYVRFYLISWLGERVVADLRREVFSHMLRLSPGWYEHTRTGEVISRLTTDTALLEQVVGTSVSMALRNLLMGTGALVMLMVTSWKLTALVLLTVPIVIGPIVLFGRRVRSLSRASQDRVADLGAYVDEALHEIRTVQAYGHEREEERAFARRVEDAFATARRRIRVRAALIASVILLVFAGVGVILWVGGHDVLAGRISAGELSAFVFYAAIVAGAAGALSEVVGDLQRGAGAAQRLLEILATEPWIQAPSRPLPLPEPPVGRVSFERVTFFYPARPATAALDDFSLEVQPGEKLALVGPSGAGKSTVFHLLLRFYDPTAGAVRLDGVDLRLADPAAVRGRIALVPQEPAIFAASVAANVRYGRPEATEAQLRAACEAAFAAEFIEGLPQKYETFLGERGVRLSAGQRQRLAIARAILADRPVLLLDEATSALDSESERMVQAALERLMRGRTVLIIAHRLSTVKSADRIAIIDHGRLIGIGKHEELLRSNALYARLAALQFGTEPSSGR